MRLDPPWELRFWRVAHLDIELMHGIQITYDYPRHLHEEHSICVMLQGVETIEFEGASYRAIPGDLMLINADTAHANRSVGSTYRVIKIKPELLATIASDVGVPAAFREPVVRDAVVFPVLLNLHCMLEHTSSRLEEESAFLSTIGLLLQRQNPTTTVRSSAESRAIGGVRDYLRSHYAENVSLAQLTSMTGLSPFHLLRVFRKRFGVPPHEYQTQVRVAHARRLIREGHSLTDAALASGFFDQSHLCRNFKRIVGMTPGQYLSRSKIVQDAARRPQ